MNIIENKWWDNFVLDLPNTQSLKLISPFITENMVRLLLDNWRGTNVQIITRFNLNDFLSGVSSLKALKRLVSRNVKIKGIKDLHSKVYIFDQTSVIITSANFTNGGFFNNYEFGVRSNDVLKVAESIAYFERLWDLDISELTLDVIDEWQEKINQSKPVIPQQSLLEDFGVSITDKVINNRKYFVKFYGQSYVRAALSKNVFDEVTESHCHFAVTFPLGKGRPRRYRDGDIVYMACMLHNNDYAIFGRAIARKHVDKRDVASDEDKAEVTWKKAYPIYIRVHSGEFIDSTFGNCPKLKNLMYELKAECFEPSKRKFLKGEVNYEPQFSLRQQADIQLSDEGAFWLENQFDEAKKIYSIIPQSQISALYQGNPTVH